MPSDDVHDNPILFCVCEKESKFIDPITISYHTIGCVEKMLIQLGIFARLFLENSISTASPAKTNFHQSHILIKSHSIFGKDYFCSVRRWRPPDWLTLYPWRRLSAVFRGLLVNLCLMPLVAQSGAESGRVTAFSAMLQRKTIRLTPHWTRAKTAQDKNLINQWHPGLFSSWWIGIANYTTTLVLLRL